MTAAQVQVLVRANDPLYELGFRLRVVKEDDASGAHAHQPGGLYGVQGQVVTQQINLVDPRVQWSGWQRLA